VQSLGGGIDLGSWVDELSLRPLLVMATLTVAPSPQWCAATLTGAIGCRVGLRASCAIATVRDCVIPFRTSSKVRRPASSAAGAGYPSSNYPKQTTVGCSHCGATIRPGRYWAPSSADVIRDLGHGADIRLMFPPPVYRNPGAWDIVTTTDRPSNSASTVSEMVLGSWCGVT